MPPGMCCGENEDVTEAGAPHRDWDDSYAGPPPSWDIGRPQPAFVRLAERGVDATFRVLDVLFLDTLGERFDTLVDSGLFHVFADASRSRYVTAAHATLRPGGHLHLMCFSDRQPGDWGPRRVTEDELRAAFGPGWPMVALAPDRFEINPGLGSPTAEAWLTDVVRLAPR